MTHRKSLLNGSLLPDGTPGVYLGIGIGGNKLNFIFGPGSGSGYIYGMSSIPSNYLGSPKIVVVWTGPSTTWYFSCKCVKGRDIESLTPILGSPVVIPGAGASVSGRRLEDSGNITEILHAGATLVFQFGANLQSGTSSTLVDLLLEYTG